MRKVPRILIVHSSEDVDALKRGLLEMFPALEGPEYIATADIEYLYQRLLTAKHKFDILIATEKTPIFEIEKTLRKLKERKHPVSIAKVIVPFKLVEIDITDWKPASLS